MTATKVATETKSDEAKIELLELNNMMLTLKDQRNRFLPDDEPTRLDGNRRPVRFLMHADQTMRDVILMLPAGIKSHNDIHENPLCLHRIMLDNDLRLKVTDKVTFMAHDFTWMHRAVVTCLTPFVRLKPEGTAVELEWSKPQVVAVKAA